MKRSLFLGLLAALLAIALVAAACGGGATTTTAPRAGTTAAVTTDSTTTSAETTGVSGTESTSSGAATGEPIKIGWLADFSGDAAPIAASLEKGISVQVEYVNSQGGIGGRPLEVVALDTKTDAATAIANITKLIKDSGVSAVIGSTAPFLHDPCRAIAEETQTPYLDNGISSKKQLEAKPQLQWAFGLNAGSIAQGNTLTKIIKEHGWKKLIGVHDVLSINEERVAVARDNGPKEGYSINVLPDVIQLGMSDYQPILNKIMTAYRADKPDAISLEVNMNAAPAMYQGLRALGVTVPIVSGPTAAHPAIFAMGPEAIEGLLVFDLGGSLNPTALPDGWPLKAGQLEFAQRYQVNYDSRPDFQAMSGANMISVLATAMEQAGGDDKEKVQQALVHLTDYVGLVGIITFTPELTAEGSHGHMVEWQVKDGQFTLVKTFE